MRRNRIRLAALALTLAAMLLLPVGALAQVGENMFYVSCDGCVAQQEYALFVLKPGVSPSSMKDDDIYFVDQLSSADGRIEAVVVFPDFQECSVWLGGTFAGDVSSPRKLGDYSALRLPGQLQTIEKEAFYGTGLTHVYLGNSTLSVGEKAFAQCASLAYVYMPRSVTDIANDAFEGSGNVVIGCYSDSAAKAYAVSNGIRYKLLD